MTDSRGRGLPLSHDCQHGRSSLAFALVALVAILLPGQPAYAKKSSWSLQDKLRVHVLYELGYDSNYLEFSDRDQDRFVDNEMTLATDIDSYDAMVQSAGLKFNVRTPKLFGWRNGSLTYSISYQNYLNNSFNDRAVHSAFFTHDLMNRADIFGSYLYIPSRYLRDYYDRDYGAVYACDFQYSLGGVGVRYSPKMIKGLRLSARYENFTVYYNPRFTEYDTQGWGYRLDARYRLTKDLSVTGIYKKRLSDNVGFDGTAQAAGVDLPDAEYGDGSNGEDWFEVVLSYDTPKILKREWDVSLSARFRHRYYTSELSLADDPIHRGREHLHSRYGIEITGPIVGNLEGGPVVDYEMRSTDSPVDYVPLAKDFSTWRAGLVLSYKLW